MTKLEIMTANKKAYAELEAQIKKMNGIEKVVAENLTLAWIKGNKWMGGLSDSKANKIYEKLMDMGYSFEEIDDEFQKQINKF